MILFSENLKYILNLSILNLSSILLYIDNNIGNEGIKVCSKNMKYLTKLTKLDISCIIN